MAIVLKKGESAPLDHSMKIALVGLGWDPNKYDGGYPFNLDVSAFVLGANGKVISDDAFVFYNNFFWRDHTVWMIGDDIPRSLESDNEQIFIDFTRIPDYVSKIVITVTIYKAEECGQNFGQFSNAYVRVAKVQSASDTQGETVIRFDLEEKFSVETALVVCEIYRENGHWKINAVASCYQGGLKQLCHMFGVNVE